MTDLFYICEYLVYNNYEVLYERQIGGLSMQTRRDKNLLSLGIILGTITGAVVAYFFAPQDGEKTKKDIAKNLNNFTQSSILKTQNALIQFEQALEKSKREDDTKLNL